MHRQLEHVAVGYTIHYENILQKNALCSKCTKRSNVHELPDIPSIPLLNISVKPILQLALMRLKSTKLQAQLLRLRRQLAEFAKCMKQQFDTILRYCRDYKQLYFN